MKILFVISTLRAGGAERVAALLASKFSLDHGVTLLKFDSAEPFYELSERVKLVNLSYGADEAGIIGNFKKRLGKILAIRKIIKEGGFDAAISFLDSTNVLVLAAALGLKTPVIATEHTSFDAGVAAKIYEVLKRLFYPRASAVSVLTKTDAAHYAKYCKNVFVAYNPLFLRPAQKPAQKQNAVLFVGRLVAVKNCEAFVRLAAKFRGEGWEFCVAGDGAERERLEALNRESGAGVKFLGNVANIGELYANAKILVSTSRAEGFGNALIEAAAADVARVASKTGGAAELITDGFDGILYEQGDESALAEAVRNLMRDEAAREKICANARLRLGEFSLDKIYERWTEILRSVCRPAATK